jgi:photosystem II stability/assembly factor-like uncharacterized protein
MTIRVVGVAGALSILLWSAVGHAGGDPWRPTDGPRAGAVWAVAVDPANAHTILAGTDNGVFRRGSGGRGWRYVGLRSELVNAIVIDPTDSDTIYAGAAGRPGGLFRSRNGGKSWVRVGPRRAVGALAIDPRDSDVVYAGTWGGGVFRSVDGGAHWVSIEGKSISVGCVQDWVVALALDPSRTRTIYAGSDGVCKSTDGGKTWRGLDFPYRRQGWTGRTIAVDPLDPKTVYVGTDHGGVFKSTNDGNTWRSTGLVGRQVRSLIISPGHSRTLYAGRADGVFVSPNGGRSWRAFNDGLSNLSVTALAVDSGGLMIHAGTHRGGVFTRTATR